MNVLSYFRQLFKPAHPHNEFPKNAVFIDVSAQADFEKEHFQDSINIPFRKLPTTISLILRYSVPIVIVSSCEELSEKAVKILLEAGVLVYNGGDWRNL